MADWQLLNSFYGDDFTGTMATAENFMLAGIPTVVFTRAPSMGLVKRSFPGIQVVGIAGIARTLSVEQLERELVSVYETMRSYGALSYLYKVCSTFDSSPAVGNIGRAAELGIEAFDPDYPLKKRTVRILEEAGFSKIESAGSIWTYTVRGYR